MKTGLIVTGGRLDLSFAGDFVKNLKQDPQCGSLCVVAVDAGLSVLESLKLHPAAVVGDFDTVDPQILEQYRRDPAILWDVHKPEKDETDTELAIHTAFKLGCGQILILGATGGRLDHELSNIHLLKLCLDRGVDACLCDSRNKVYLLAGEHRFRKTGLFGTYVSFIPLTETVCGITLEGFKYPLSGRNISIGAEAGLCVSNEVTADEAVIRFTDGILICIESRD